MVKVKAGRERAGQKGFVLMFTLIVVALTGLVMVETAPDFSNYAVLAKADEFDRNLGTLRKVMSTNPFALTTFDSYDPLDVTPGILTENDLNNALKTFIVADGATISASRTILSTVPMDPYVPFREWLSNTPQSKFWASSYNFVSNPSFFTGTREEAYLADSVKVYFLGLDGSGQYKLYSSDRFGRTVKTICYQKATTIIKECALSPDGTIIAFSSNDFDDGTYAGVNYDIFVAGTNTFIPRPVTDHRRSITLESLSHSKPTWSADGALLAVTVNDLTGTRADILLTQPLKDDPAYPYSDGATVITTGVHSITDFNCAWSPMGGDETFPGRSRYLAYCADSLGTAQLGLWDRKTSKFIFDRVGGAPSPTFLAMGKLPCEPHIPVWGNDSNEILYIRDGTRKVVLIREPTRYPSTLFETFDTGIEKVASLKLIPKDADLANRSNWIIFQKTDDKKLYRTSFNPPEPGSKKIYHTNKTAIGMFNSGYNTAESGFAISERGSMMISFPTASDTLTINSIDGQETGKQVITATGLTIKEAFFSKTNSPWVGPAPANVTNSFPNVKLVSPTKKDTAQYVEGDIWRNFVNNNKDFSSDFKLGNSWIRLHPPENQNQLLFDDSNNIWRISTENPSIPPDKDRFNFGGKIDPTWSHMGATYISKEAKDPTGGEPADLFKQAFRSATTLIAGNGYTPDISPDDSEYCYSQSPGTLSTYPGDSTTYPIDNLDLWVANSGGASEPPPRNLTPNTPFSYESEPSYSPDGRHIYFTREKQNYGEFLPNHESTIARITPYGGSLSIIAEGGNLETEWSNSLWNSQIECYHPSASPDGTRVAFVGKERYLGGITSFVAGDNFEEGDIITECVYVKDVLMNRDPVLLLRVISEDPSLIAATDYVPVNDTILRNCSIDSLTWTPDGEEIMACITHPMNRKFPKRTNERGSTDVSHSALETTPYYSESDQQIVLAIPVSISHFNDTVNSKLFNSGNMDPPGFNYGEENFRLIAQNEAVTGVGHITSSAYPEKVPQWIVPPQPLQPQKIFNITHSHSAHTFQRIITDSPFFDTDGVNLGIWYVLSGFIRTSMDLEALSSAQMMIQLFNNRGTMINLNPLTAEAIELRDKTYQVGFPDLGGTEWTRFSAAITLIPDGNVHINDQPPYYINLMLYIRGKPGSWAEFTGLKLEKAYDQETVRPTQFAPGWLLFSPSLNPDPRRPGHILYER
jgi:Tol biopolymer transport system component